MGYNPRSEEQRQTRQLTACIREKKKQTNTNTDENYSHKHTLNGRTNKLYKKKYRKKDFILS